MLYWIGRTLFYNLFKTVFRLKVTGRENIPEGGFIIAANHNSLIDPPLMGTSLSRGVYFMAKKELFEIPLLGKIISMTHAIPVDRRRPGADSVKEVLNILREGKIMMVLPEGTRKKSGKIKSGIGFLAHKSGALVVPARIVNNDKIKRLPGLEFNIKKPLRYPASYGEDGSKNDYRHFAEKVMERIYS